ncbi:MAG: hypothetical protein JST59_01475 [Actinobacteria bacterium]|nr:hypothetical protein [Actinomycetota bacterium]
MTVAKTLLQRRQAMQLVNRLQTQLAESQEPPVEHLVGWRELAVEFNCQVQKMRFVAELSQKSFLVLFGD